MAAGVFPKHFHQDCPACKTPVNSSATIDGEDAPPPGEGDLSVCVECASPMRWRQGRLEPLSLEAYKELDPPTRAAIDTAIGRVAAFHKHQRRWQ